MIPDHYNWVCATCGQGLTRKSSAIRHNKNLHSGNAILVRPLDYVIGRLNGTFLPSDPSLYRHKRADNSASRREANRTGSVAAPIYSNLNQPLKDFKYARRTPFPLDPSQILGDDKTTDTRENSLGRILNLKEFEVLVKKHYRPDIARQMILLAAMQANLGGDHQLNSYLTYLRNLDRAKSQ